MNHMMNEGRGVLNTHYNIFIYPSKLTISEVEMSFTPFAFYGYEIQLHPEMDLRSSISLLYDLNGMIPSPFEIRCILTTFYPAMSEEEHARIVIGFDPEHVDQMFDQAADLKSFIDDTPLLDGLEVSDSAAFHCGIEWHPEPESDIESEIGSGSETESEIETDIETDDD
jgi:hypothetical protein